MIKMTLTCPYCGQQVSIRNKECRECGCPMSVIMKELIVETTESAREALEARNMGGAVEEGGGFDGAVPEPSYGDSAFPGQGSPSDGAALEPSYGDSAFPGQGSPSDGAAAESFSGVPAQGPLTVYLNEMAAKAGDPRLTFLLEELSQAADKVNEAKQKSELYRGNLILLKGIDSMVAREEGRLAALQDEYRHIGGFFSGARRERKMKEIDAAKARLESSRRHRESFVQRNIPDDPDELEDRLSSAMQEEERIRHLIVPQQGPALTGAREAIMSDGSLLAQALTEPAVFAHLDRDLCFKTGLDPSGPAVRALAAYPEALARLQVRDLPADLLEQVEGSYRTSVLGSYEWTPTSLARWIERCCAEQPSLARYEIRTDVLPAYFGVKGQYSADRPVELLLLQDGRPVLAVHTASVRDAKKGMAYVKRACRRQGIAYTHLLTDYPNYRHYVVRRLLTALGEL